MVSLLYCVNGLVSGEHLLHLLLYKKEIFTTFKKPLECVTIFEDEIVNKKAFELANLIFTEPWTLKNEIMLKIMQNFKFDFLKNKFQADWGVRCKFHFRKLYIIFPRYFFRFIEEYQLEKDTSIFCKNGSLLNKTCCELIALVLKTKIYFCHCNFISYQTIYMLP